MEKNEPSDFKQMLTIFTYQFKNYIRSKRLYIMLIIISIIITIFVAVNSYYGDPAHESTKSTAEDFLGFVPTLAVLTALFFGGDAIAAEYQNKTGYFLFPNPVKRHVIFWGKYIASLLASAIILLLYYFVGAIYVYWFHTEIPVEYLFSLLYAFIFLISLLSLTYFFSTLFRNGAIALTIVAILYFFVFNIVNGISQLAGVEPWYSITYAADIITLVFEGKYMGDYSHLTVMHRGGITLSIYLPYLWEGVVIMVAYFIVSAVLAMFIFGRKEMK